MKLLFQLMLRSGGGAAPIANPQFALVGDSLTQFGSNAVALNGVTMTRDAAGVVTVAKTSHGIYGSPTCYTFNCTADTSYEALAEVTVINANSYSYPTSVTGLAGSIVGTTNTSTTIQNRLAGVSYWVHLQSLFTGGARMLGNFGQGGDRADEMAGAVASACATAAEFVILAAGINDINTGGASGATVISRISTHVDTIIAAGKKCVLVGVTPLGSAFASIGKNTATLDANTGLSALANGTTIFFADPHPDLVDTGATQFTTGAAWSWVATDGVHWGERTAKIVAQKIYDAIAAKVTVVNCLPTSVGNLPTIPGYTAIFERGAWDATVGGSNGVGSSGNITPKMSVASSNAATTIVNSLVDRGSSALGYYQNQVITPGGAGHDVSTFFYGNSGIAIGSLGLTTSDTVILVAEYCIEGATASNVTKINLQIQSNSSGGFGLASCGDYGALSNGNFRNDSLTDIILMTGPLKLNASITTLLSKVDCRVGGAGAAFTQKIGRVVLYKKNP